MGNPTRYICENKFIGQPIIQEDRKTLTINSFNKDHFEKEISLLQIDMYQAPDVIFPYANGNTNQDEFRRYYRDKFENLTLIKKQEFAERIEYEYKFENFNMGCFGRGLGQSDENRIACEDNIPIGKFSGMTYQQVQEYKERNK